MGVMLRPGSTGRSFHSAHGLTPLQSGTAGKPTEGEPIPKLEPGSVLTVNTNSGNITITDPGGGKQTVYQGLNKSLRYEILFIPAVQGRTTRPTDSSALTKTTPHRSRAGAPGQGATPAANANGAGYASFTFQVRDDGGTANGGVDLDTSERAIVSRRTVVLPATVRRKSVMAIWW